MSVISIVGTSGVGKSFLVKQLSALTQNPAFFEGEEGTIPESIFESIFNDSDPSTRWRFFMERYKKNLVHASEISKKLHIDCFVDGAMMSAEAILTQEDTTYTKELEKLLSEYTHITSDVIVLLTANKACLSTFITSRSRQSEHTHKAIERALAIQEAFIKIANSKSNVLLLDRTNLDFTKYADVQVVFRKIQSMCHI